MRIIAGKFRGRRLQAVGAAQLRPTSDRLRETLFDVLTAARPLEETIWLDLFAGTGGVGIEALSRGAARVCFVESARGSLTLRLTLPPGTELTPVRFRWDGGSRVVRVPAGGSRTVTFPLDARGVWELHFSTTQTGTLGDGRAISVKAAEPLLRRT